MLREARIVMPLKLADGLVEHRQLRSSLLEAFGGYTRTFGKGAWRDAGKDFLDEVAIYDVAIEASRDANWDKLFQIAMQAGRELKQQAVYIRYPDGSVCIEPVEAPKVPLGGRRLPAVGEMWETSSGATVAIVADASLIDGGYNVVVLKGSNGGGFKPGAPYNVDLDGKVLPDKSSHPRDLKRFIKDF